MSVQDTLHVYECKYWSTSFYCKNTNSCLVFFSFLGQLEWESRFKCTSSFEFRRRCLLFCPQNNKHRNRYWSTSLYCKNTNTIYNNNNQNKNQVSQVGRLFDFVGDACCFVPQSKKHVLNFPCKEITSLFSGTINKSFSLLFTSTTSVYSQIFTIRETPSTSSPPHRSVLHQTYFTVYKSLWSYPPVVTPVHYTWGRAAVCVNWSSGWSVTR